MKNRFYKKLYHLYFDLNDGLLTSLKEFTQIESNGLYTLENLLRVYADKCSHGPTELKFITQLHNTQCIGDQEAFYDYISDMIFMLD